MGYNLSVVSQNRWNNKDGVKHVSRSNNLFWLEENWARVFQSSLNTVEGTTQIVHVTLSWRSRGSEAEDYWSDGIGCSIV
jgi:hypothetical protein